MRPVVGADGAGVPVGFGVPGEVTAEHQFDGQVEAAVSGARIPVNRTKPPSGAIIDLPRVHSRAQ